MTLDSDERGRLAIRLERAYRLGEATEPLPAGMTVSDAYEVQAAFAALRGDAGARHVGYKVGATSALSQQALAVDEPMFGPLFDDMLIDDGAVCTTGGLIDPRVEIEVAFEIGEHPPAPRRAAPAFEIIDSRVAGPAAGVQHAIADLARACRFACGAFIEIAELPPAETLHGRLLRDGEEAATGSAMTVLGDPYRSLDWLAKTLGLGGATLRPGDIVLSGTFIAPQPAGGYLEARFSEPLGTVAVHFTETQGA